MMEAFEKVKKTSHSQKSIRVKARKQWFGEQMDIGE